jgi:transposase
MKITTVGIDIAKKYFKSTGVGMHCHAALKRQTKRDHMLTFFINLPPRLIWMEACGSAPIGHGMCGRWVARRA